MEAGTSCRPQGACILSGLYCHVWTGQELGLGHVRRGRQAPGSENPRSHPCALRSCWEARQGAGLLHLPVTQSQPASLWTSPQGPRICRRGSAPATARRCTAQTLSLPPAGSTLQLILSSPGATRHPPAPAQGHLPRWPHSGHLWASGQAGNDRVLESKVPVSLPAAVPLWGLWGPCLVTL